MKIADRIPKETKQQLDRMKSPKKKRKKRIKNPKIKSAKHEHLTEREWRELRGEFMQTLRRKNGSLRRK